MKMTEWAENEVKIACKRERGGKDETEWDYGCACYESALKAYKSLAEDGHSGMSYGFTVRILKRLLDEKPLTPIEDVPEVWSLGLKSSEREEYQCKRKPSLFKSVYADGTVEYEDIGRTIIRMIEDSTSWHSYRADKIIDEMFPIEFPYTADKTFVVDCDEFLTDKRNGDFDTQGFLIATINGKEKVEINRYFSYDNDKVKEISKEEFEERKARKIND